MIRQTQKGRAFGIPAFAVLATFALASVSATPASGQPPESRPDRVKYLSYQLSYVEAAHAAALLRTLGYQTIQYSVGPTGPISDSIAALESGTATKPVIVQILDPESMSIVGASRGGAGLGGQVFENITSGIPHQRFLIAWNDSEQLQTLLSLLNDQIDVPAKQILIEALIIELSKDVIGDLGFDYSSKKDGNSLEFGSLGGGNSTTPFTYTFTRPSAKTILDFTGRITALVTDGKAQVLSRPSVLVLDGRQARIKVGDKFPYIVTSTTSFGAELVSDTKYVDVGIVLNLRPRASDDNSEVTMQVETQISSSGGSGGGSSGIGPQVQNREVQTLVRVANNTPLIIGGLISQSTSDADSGVPGLKRIPLLGRLFRRSSNSRKNTEVIVVIIPHVVPPEDKAFTYSIAKDFDLFDQFDLSLFQNVYRVRQEDVWDLDFIRGSDFYTCLEKTAELKAEEISTKLRLAGRTPVAATNTAGLAAGLREWMAAPEGSTAGQPPPELTEQYIGMLEGKVPGERILVKRMIVDIIRKLGLGDQVNEEQIILFEKNLGPGAVLEIQQLTGHLDALGGKCETLEMLYETFPVSGMIFDPPTASITLPHPVVEQDQYVCEMRKKNCLNRLGERWDSLAMLLNRCYVWQEKGPLGPQQTIIDLLKNVLVLKRVLDLNPELPLTLDAFGAGREVIFPTEEDLRQHRYLVDRDTVQLFYEMLDSWYAFEQRIRLALDALATLGGDRPRNCAIERSLIPVQTVVDPCSCQGAASSTSSSGSRGLESPADSLDGSPTQPDSSRDVLSDLSSTPDALVSSDTGEPLVTLRVDYSQPTQISQRLD